MPRIPDEIVERVRERSDIVEIVSQYVTLKRAGRNFKGLSPFNNEKTPSFVVSPDKQIFNCFSSGIGGNVFTFVMQMERVEFPDAVRLLARKHGIEIPEDQQGAGGTENKLREQIFAANNQAAEYYHELLLADSGAEVGRARDYLKNRGVSLETVKNFRLGFALDRWDGLIRCLQDKNVPLRVMEQAGLIKARQNKEGYYDCFRNRIIFPITDNQGRVRAFGARALDNEGAKYINSPETAVYTKGDHVYGFDVAKSVVTQEDMVVIVEGYMDCVIPQQAGFRNIVASLGTALTQQQVRNIRRFTRNVVMLYDNDKAGEAAMIRSFDLLIEEGMEVKVASLAPGEDPDSYIRKHGVEAFRERIDAALELFE
ncbi:MAG: DNA primase, partial [Candidatus Omnitrophica bacterium]|nr:DNA primase [Candidatus Omnitrophota bacterium]